MIPEIYLAVILTVGIMLARRWWKIHKMSFGRLTLAIISWVHPALYVVLIASFTALALTHAARADETEYIGYVNSSRYFAAVAFMMVAPAIISYMHRRSMTQKSQPRVMLREVQRRPVMARRLHY